MPRPFVLLLALLASAAPGSSPAGDIYSTPTGDVLVEIVATEPGRPGEGIGRGIVEAPPERVFLALTDYAHWREFMPFLEASDARPGPEGSVESEHRMGFPAPLGERRYRVRFRHWVEEGPSGKAWRIEWSHVPGSGNVAGHRGSWALTALGAGRTLAVCRLFTDLGAPFPSAALDRSTSRMLSWIFHGLRQHVRRSRYDRP